MPRYANDIVTEKHNFGLETVLDSERRKSAAHIAYTPNVVSLNEVSQMMFGGCIMNHRAGIASIASQVYHAIVHFGTRQSPKERPLVS